MKKLEIGIKMSEKKNAIKNIIGIVISNVLTLLVGILSGFVVPKILSIDSYGYYKTFSLYISYCGLFHFGITNGAYLFFAGQRLEEIDKRKAHSVIASIVLLETLLSGGLICFASLSNLSFNTKLIYILVAVYNFVLQFESILRNILEATKCFKYESVVSVLKSVLTIILLLSFFGLSKYFASLREAFYFCCLFMIIAVFLSSFLYALKLRGIVFSRGQPLSETKKDVFLFVKIGLPLMICNLTGTLINSIDRQFVSIFFPVESSTVFAEYSFAYSMLAFVTTATAAVATVVYPYMKGKDTKTMVNFYPSFQTIILLFVSASFISYFAFSWFVPLFLPKYAPSLSIFKVLLPNLALDVCVTIVMHNYFKYLNQEKRFLIINLATLVLTISLNFAAYYLLIARSENPDPIWFSVASVLCGLIWYVVSSVHLKKISGVKHFKNTLFLFAIIIIFYSVSFCIEPWWKGCLIYIILSAFLIIVFYSSDFGRFFKKKNRVNI